MGGGGSEDASEEEEVVVLVVHRDLDDVLEKEKRGERLLRRRHGNRGVGARPAFLPLSLLHRKPMRDPPPPPPARCICKVKRRSITKM